MSNIDSNCFASPPQATRVGSRNDGALQHVAQVTRIVFQSARQIGVTGSRPFDAPRFLRRDVTLVRRHHLVPVGPIFVLDYQCQGRSERQPVPHTAEDFNPVLLDLHPRAATVTLLTAPKFVIDLRDIDGQPGGQTFNYRHERFSV